jgi:Zn-dependent protease with chaperone function
MNFFEQQDIARRNTKRLVLLLLLAIGSLIAVTTLLLGVTMLYLQGNSAPPPEVSLWARLTTLLDWQTVSGITLVVMTVVLLGGLYKYQQLRRGGRVVAEALGGRLLNTDSRDLHERQLLNIVEEMAIASGAPVPPVYLLEEPAINAFAAGHTPQDAVIGITRGCIEQLDRDELQGVIAHEFSHIFHGDMRLNMRLVAILNGILLLGLIGHFIVRSTLYSRAGRSRRDNNNALALVGVGLMVIGYAGTFFGNIIKAAVSRQREFLADASAVQFTRSDTGIAGALKKIGGLSHGSKLEASHSAEFSHMYFSQGVSTAFNSLMATHPPLTQRIKRLQPSWNGSFTPPAKTQPAPEPTSNDTPERRDGFVQAAVLAGSINHIGQPDREALTQARRHMDALGPALREAAHNPSDACAITIGLLLDNSDRAIRQRQWRALTQHYSHAVLKNWRTTVKQAAQVDPQERLALLELCLPALKSLSAAQAQQLQAAIDTLIAADQAINLHEWSLRRIVTHHLGEPLFHSQHKPLRQQREHCQVVLSYLAHAGTQQPQQTAHAFAQAAQLLRMSELTLLPLAALNIAQLDHALAALNRVRPLQKPQLLKAMVQAIQADGIITATEAELFRAIADSLNCPVPPLSR